MSASIHYRVTGLHTTSTVCVYMYWWFRCCSAAPVVVVEAIFLFRRKPAEVPVAILHRNVCEIIKLRIAASASDAATATPPTQPSIDRFPFLFFLFSFSIPGGIEYRLIWYRFSIFLLLLLPFLRVCVCTVMCVCESDSFLSLHLIVIHSEEDERNSIFFFFYSFLFGFVVRVWTFSVFFGVLS